MKKIALLLISLVLIFGIIGCNNDVNKPSKTELPSVELPSDFNPDKNTDGYKTTIEKDGDLANTINTIKALFPNGQVTQNQDVMAVASSLISAAMEKGIALTLPDSNGNTLDVKVTGSMSDDLKVIKYNIVANVDYSFSDVSVKGNVVGILTIDTSKLKPSAPAQYNEGTSIESPYNFEFAEGTDLKISVNKSDNKKECTIQELFNNENNEIKEIKELLFKALKESYEQLLDDTLTMVANFFKEGYSIETKELSISIKGDLKYELATPKTRDINFNNYYEQFGNLFNNLFKYISLENIVLDIKTKEDIVLAGTKINGHIIVGAEYAKLEPAKETVWVPAESTIDNGIKASISFDVSGALNITIGEDTHEIYAKGHFDGISGASGGVVDGQEYTINAYLRFDGTNYNLSKMIETALDNLNKRPVNNK